MATQDLAGRLGRYVERSVAGERYRAYVPPPLPPDPPVRLDALSGLLEQASTALGRLDGLTSILPDAGLFIHLYIRKEAVLSSRIEGSQSTLADLMLYEGDGAPDVPLDDLKEVSNYVAAMRHGLARLRDGFPMSLRLIREIHGILLASGRGAARRPGEFRTSQNWIGGSRPGNARFVPPPPEMLMEVLGPFETFLHAQSPDLPILVKAALAHVQFETIHPFLDGNGRLGRLLITFLLCAAGALQEPILYLSLYFNTQRQRYYDLLDAVREHGAWESWLAFFLTGVSETADQAAQTARRLLVLLDEDRARIDALGRPTATVRRVHDFLQTSPILSVRTTASKIGLTPPTVGKAVQHLSALGILREITGRQRDRLFVYDRYLKLLDEGTEPPTS